MSDVAHDPAALDLSLDDAHRAAMALLPQGAVWPRDPTGVLSRTVRGLTGVHHHAWRRVRDMLSEADARTTYETLRMWEIDCGLPDPCLADPPTSIEARRSAVLARRAEHATTTPMQFIALAARMGYEISIVEFRPFRVWSECDAWINGGGWVHAWMVNIAADRAIHVMRANSACNAFIREWVTGDIECVITRLAPAHTEVVFAYP